MSHLVVGGKKYEKRSYELNKCISFAKVNAPYGGLHNMAPNYHIKVSDLTVKTSEHLYQALSFPDRPDIQEKILNEKSPMTAKFIMKENIELKRKDWDEVKVPIMKWCLMMKLINNWESFGGLLFSTGNNVLVEYSKKDDFWGAMRYGEKLIGVNASGRLLMGIREEIKNIEDSTYRLELPNVKDLILLGDKLGVTEKELTLLA